MPKLSGRLVVASHNAGKVREIGALLAPLGVEAVSAGALGLPEPEEDAPALPLLIWDRRPLREGGLDAAQIEELVLLILAHPDRLLFAIPWELGTSSGSHPTTTRRVLYLWKNREAIEAR